MARLKFLHHIKEKVIACYLLFLLWKISWLYKSFAIYAVYDPEIIVEKVGGSVEVQNDRPERSKPLKEKTSKAERRALQEAQRAAKGAKVYFF